MKSHSCFKIYVCFLLKGEKIFVSGGGGNGKGVPGDGHSLAKMTVVESSGQNRNLKMGNSPPSPHL